MPGPAALSSFFAPTTFDIIRGWADGPVLPAFRAFIRSGARAAARPYRTGSLGVESAALAQAYAKAPRGRMVNEAAARAFFEAHFIPCRVAPGDVDHGFVTGYYEPEIEASRQRTGRFCVPLYARPPDLVDVTDDNRPPEMDPYFVFARDEGSRLIEYHDRQAVDRGALAGRGLEIAWVESKVEAYFIHVQGAARLKLPDSETMRVTYAAKTGHPFTGAGKVLIGLGEIAEKDVTMQTIRAWFEKNPGRIDEILWQNRSFIFFRETELGDPQSGPVAAAKVQLEPGYSLAVDRFLHTFGTPFFIDAPRLEAVDAKPFRRLMIAQDTGSAIVGPARGDLFVGTGGAAGEIAGVVRHAADFYALVPRVQAEALL